jgi:hypothetical protein
VTATRDRQSDLDEDPTEPSWDERPIVGNYRGLPWWGAVLLAFGLAAIAAWIDMHRLNSLGRIYQAAYVLGCLVAVAWVRRRNLFGPMVQPPLVFAVTAIGAVLLNQPGSPFSAGFKQLILSVALPLTSNFPTMAITTGAAVAIGLFRLWLQRDPYPRVRPNRGAGREPEPVGAFSGGPGPGRDRGEPGARRSRDRSPADRGADFDRAAADRAGLDRTAGRPRSTRPRPGDSRQRSGRETGRSDTPRTGRGRTDPPSGDRPLRGERRLPPPEPDRRQRRDSGDRRMDQPGPDQPRRRPRRPPEDYR